MADKIINVENTEQIQNLFGPYDENINVLQRQYGVVVISRGTEIKVSGSEENVNNACEAIESLMKISNTGEKLTGQTIRYVASMVSDGEGQQIQELVGDGICVTAAGKIVRPRTVGQKKYTDGIKKNTIVMGIGPAGTGKTYLAVAMDAKAFKAHEISKIILTRPAVEAGEKLGFLPGDLKEKIDPYLKPLYDALFDIMGSEAYERNVQRGNIEIAPLAYMRGRTLNNSFIILDEAQNTTREQMKMFLTRLGDGSKAVVTGDITQIDLPSGRKSGLVYSQRILGDVDGVDFVHLTKRDVVRNPLVQRIIEAYEKFEGKRTD